jgi:hypothetical protein
MKGEINDDRKVMRNSYQKGKKASNHSMCPDNVGVQNLKEL